MRSHDDSVLKQFDPRAAAYLTSAVHASGPDLERASELLAGANPDLRRALDIGCGAGHLSFLMAKHVKEVVASDPAAGMLDVVQEAARARGLRNISVSTATAFSLPFPDGHFDVVATRYSAHHWTDMGRALAEVRRVVRGDGHVLVIDLLGDPSPLVNTHLQAMEVLRDPSHVCSRTAAEWHAAFGAAGFHVIEHREWPLRLDFGQWTTRMQVAAEHIAAIRGLQSGASREVSQGLGFEADGSFTAPTGLFWVRRGGGN